MKSKFIFILIPVALFIAACADKESKGVPFITIGSGQMPDISRDNENNLHLVYGHGDSIFYALSSNEGKSFSSPDLVTVIPGLAASHMRGPQIASGNGVNVIACDNAGNIFSYSRESSGTWSPAAKVNDVDTVAKEQLMDLAADGGHYFAVWLDLRNKHNEIYGASSMDAGKSWSKNRLIYASPDTTVCECCKPSVVVSEKNVYVMFRNWLKGNRDLYLIGSSDRGTSFGQAIKLGNDSWPLNGCPMDGGGLVVDNKGMTKTVWVRKKTIYSCEPGKPEEAIGQGRSCTIESVNGKNVYAWTENGKVVVVNPKGEKILLGDGSMPVLKSVSNSAVLCIWQAEDQIRSAMVNL